MEKLGRYRELGPSPGAGDGASLAVDRWAVLAHDRKMQTSPHLQIRQTRTLSMTRDLREAISLLRLSNAELSAHAALLAETNPCIRIERPVAEMVAELWRRVEPEATSAMPTRPAPLPPRVGASGQSMIESVADSAAGLHDHARRQVGMILRDAEDRRIAEHFIEALEPSGWLGVPLVEISDAAGCDPPRAEAVLARIQQAEPTGLFARSLAECLELQAREQGALTPAFAKVLAHLPMLARGDLDELAAIAECDMDEVVRILAQIRSYDPKPGARFDPAQPLREPDLIVRRRQGGWAITLNRSTLADVFVRDPDGKGSDDDQRAARWLERAVARRNATTLQIAEAVVAHQAAFLAKGPAELRPMTLADLARVTGLHESTISRVGAGLMLATPRGTLTLHSLFSGALPAADGPVATAAVRHQIVELIAKEPAAAPLSDEQIARVLGERGIRIARRTVAKYREAQGISSSAERRARARLNRQDDRRR